MIFFTRRGMAMLALTACVACAPITPLPGGSTSTSSPSSSSSTSSPSSSPPAGGASGGSAGSTSGQQGSSSSSSSGSSGSSTGGGSSGAGAGRTNTLPGGNPAPGGSPGDPGGAGDSGNNDNAGDQDPSWDIPEENGAQGGWQTSNELPAGDQSSAGSPSEDATAKGSAGGEGGGMDNTQDSGSEAELRGALKDLDGEILAEREIIKDHTASGSARAAPNPTDLPTGPTSSSDSAGAGSQQASIPTPKRAMPPTPAPPRRHAGDIPKNIPDARDDDIIARQLREAAMQEEDPELREKLWQEYTKYKNG